MNKKYIPKSLSEKDKIKQKKQIEKSKEGYKKGKYIERKPVKSFKSKPSPYVKDTKKELNITNVKPKTIANKLGRTAERRREIATGLEQVLKKGKAAYYSSGSRPNQNAFSWGLSRVASVVQGGKARTVDKDIVKKYKIPKI